MKHISDEYRTSDLGLATLLIMSGVNLRQARREAQT